MLREATLAGTILGEAARVRRDYHDHPFLVSLSLSIAFNSHVLAQTSPVDFCPRSLLPEHVLINNMI